MRDWWAITNQAQRQRRCSPSCFQFFDLLWPRPVGAAGVSDGAGSLRGTDAVEDHHDLGDLVHDTTPARSSTPNNDKGSSTTKVWPES